MFNVVTPIPTSESLVCYYITYLVKAGLSYQTIKTYLSALRYLHIANNLHSPIQIAKMPKLNMLTRGIQREQANAITKKPWLPITPTMLRQIRALWCTKESDFDYKMLWAAMCVAFLVSLGWAS